MPDLPLPESRRSASPRLALAAALIALAGCSSNGPTAPGPGGGSPPPADGSAGLLVTVTALEFGELTVGITSQEQTVSVTNVSKAPIVMSGTGGTPGGAFTETQDCQGTTLNPGQSCHMVYTFQPTAGGAASATAAGAWNGQTYSISLHGTGVPLFLVTQAALSFGEVQVGTVSVTDTVNITNVSGAPIVMSGSGGAPSGAFNGVQDCQGQTLNPGQTCHMFFTFSPTSPGAATATSSGSWNGQAFSIPLSGTGVAPRFRITPVGLDFGEVTVGATSRTDTVSVTNIGTAAVVMSGVGGAPGGAFNGVQDCQGKTLNPGQTCHMFFTFSPTSSGPATATSSGSWNGQAFSIPLTGTGATGARPGLLITPVGFDFGVVPVGTTSGQQTTSVTNVGATPVLMSGTGGAPGGAFSEAQDCQGTTLNPGQTCHMLFTFSPTSTGTATATSSGSWNTQAFGVALRGTGQ